MSTSALRRHLDALHARHGIEPAPLRRLPLASPADTALVLQGLATTDDLDAARTIIAPYALAPLPDIVPLLHEHRRNEIAGSIDDLQYTASGNLSVCATVRHPEARRAPAFSIALHVIDYEIVEPRDPRRFHARVTRAKLVEISTTAVPVNPRALVTARRRPLPQAELADAALARLAHISAVLQQYRSALRG